MDKLQLIELKNSLQKRITKIIIPSAVISMIVVILCVYGISQEITNPDYLFIFLISFLPISIAITLYKVKAEIKKAGLKCFSCKVIFEFEIIDEIIESNVCSKCNQQAFDA
jgi:membrane-bound ClpP family serine protease